MKKLRKITGSIGLGIVVDLPKKIPKYISSTTLKWTIVNFLGISPVGFFGRSSIIITGEISGRVSQMIS